MIINNKTIISRLHLITYKQIIYYATHTTPSNNDITLKIERNNRKSRYYPSIHYIIPVAKQVTKNVNVKN